MVGRNLLFTASLCVWGFILLVGTACGGNGSSNSAGSLLEFVPRGADSFTVADVSRLNEEALDDLVADLVGLVDSQSLEDWEIDFDDVTSLAISDPGGDESLIVLRGEWDPEDIKDALHDLELP